MQNLAVFTKADAEIDGVVGTDQLPSLSDRSQLRYMHNIDEEGTGWRPLSSVGVLHKCQCKFEETREIRVKRTSSMSEVDPNPYHHDKPFLWRDAQNILPNDAAQILEGRTCAKSCHGTQPQSTINPAASITKSPRNALVITECHRPSWTPALTMSETAVPATPEAVEVPSPAPAISTPATPTKPVHSLVVDTNAIITNNPSISSLIAQAEALYTIPSVVAESTTPSRPSSSTIR